jgi:hypothetical protein
MTRPSLALGRGAGTVPDRHPRFLRTPSELVARSATGGPALRMKAHAHPSDDGRGQPWGNAGSPPLRNSLIVDNLGWNGTMTPHQDDVQMHGDR